MIQHLLVTGGAGFIGSAFVRCTLQQHPETVVTVLDALTYAGDVNNLPHPEDPDRLRFIHGSICDVDIVEQLVSECSAVVNFAAETHVDRSIANPGIFIETDIRGVHVLLEALRRNKAVRFLHVSTDEVYGHVPEGYSTEDAKLQPASPYSASKAGAELLIGAYHQTYGLDTVVTRGANTYGPRQFPEKLIPLFLTRLLQDKPVPVYGNGTQIRDWLYVDDHCRAIDLVLRQGQTGEAYNVGGDNHLQNIELTRRLLHILGKPDSLIHYVEDRPAHDKRYAVDSTKLHRLGYKPSMPLDAGIDATVEWYRQNTEWWSAILARPAYRHFMTDWYKKRA